jgi:hypothetical protein
MPVTTHCQGGTMGRLGAPFEHANDTSPNARSAALFILPAMLSRNRAIRHPDD